MNNKKIMWIVIGVVAIALVVFLAQSATAPTPQTGTPTGGTSQTPPKSGTGTKPPTSGGTTTKPPSGGTQTTAPKPSSGITFLSPLGGAQWVSGQLHEIKWSRAAGITGYLALLNASTKNMVGVITPSLGQQQTGMQWDTQNISAGRTNPTRITVPTGSYVIRAIFDGPVASIDSPAFSIVYASQIQTTSHTITLNQFAFSPTNVSITRGEQLVFKNNDTISYTFNFSGLRTFSLAPGASETYNTLGLSPGIYELYSDVYTTLKASVVVLQ